MDIIDLFATQIRIFSVGKIPFRMIAQRDALLDFAETFSLLPSEEKGARGELKFLNGTFELSGKKVHIDSISVDPRKIVVKVSGSSSDADQLMEKVVHFIAKCDVRNKATYTAPDEPVITTNESTIIFAHASPFKRLLDDAPVKDVHSKWKQEIDTKARAHIDPVAVVWRIWFDQLPEELPEKRVSLAEKHISIEYQGKTTDGKVLYALTAPVDTDHIKKFAQYVADWLND